MGGALPGEFRKPRRTGGRGDRTDRGSQTRCEHLYEKAIRSAHENGFVHNEALANEVAARFYAARGFEKIAYAYLQDADTVISVGGPMARYGNSIRLYPP